MADEKIEIVIPKIKSPEEYENPTELYEKLIAMIKKYHPSDEISLIEKAYKLADDAHKEQKRRSGEPYIIHPLSVAIILAEFELDKETIIAGILHDVVEDTVFTLEEITEMFGAEVAGWASLMALILCSSGLIMLMLGMLGEYIWRALDASRNRPPFIVDETKGFDESHE